MLHLLLGEPRPWHPHYFCTLALLPAFLIQVFFLRAAHDDRTAGACLCGIALFSHLVRLHSDLAVLTNVGFLFAWGVRIAVRGVPVAASMFVQPSSFDAAVSKTVWTWVLSAPTVFAVAFDTHELPKGIPTIGALVCFFAFALDLVEKNQTRGKFTRNPYVFASLSVCWGLYIIHPSPWTFVFPIIFTAIVILCSGGYRWQEVVRKASEEDETYMRTTSPLFPLPPGMYEKLSLRIKRYACCDITRGGGGTEGRHQIP